MKNTYIPAYELKATARRTMKGSFFKLLYACLMPTIVAGAITAVILNLLPGASESLQMVLRGSFASPEEQQGYFLDVLNTAGYSFQLVQALLYFLRIGGVFIVLNLLRGKSAEYKSLFAFFPGWFSAAAYSLLVFAVNFILGYAESALGELMGGSEWIYSLSELFFLIIMLFLSLKLTFAPYLLADAGCRGVIKAIKKSWKMTSCGTMWNIIVLSFSFIGWIFLSLFTMGIGFLYVLPYMDTALAALYERVNESYNF